MYMRWKSALNSMYLESYLNMVGDNRGFWLMAMRMLASINAQNIFVSVTRITYFVAHRDANFVASDKSFSTEGNWLSFNKS